MFNSRRIISAEGFAAIANIHAILREVGFDPEQSLDAFVFVASFIAGYLQIDMGRIVMSEAGRVTDYASWDSARARAARSSSASVWWPGTGTRSSTAAST